MDNLFLDQDPVAFRFEKNAAETTLPEDPNAWTNEILQELYKQIAYISDFDTHIVLDRVDGEKGYAFGHVDVSSKSEAGADATAEQQQAAGIRRARIPIIVKERKLQPFDVIITDQSKMLPLTETRLRQAIFRPQVFDVTSKTPGDISLIGQLYPPYRQNYGFGGGGAVMNMGMGKQGSVLAAILPTVNESDYQAFAAELDDQAVKVAYLRNKSASQALAILGQYQPVTMEKRAQALAATIRHDVVQAYHHPDGGYGVKMAHHSAWAPFAERVDRGELVQMFGEKVALAVDMAGSVTMADGANMESESPEADHAEPIKDFGTYKVKTSDGRAVVGYVFPNLLDLDGTSLPLVLFTNGSEYALQADLVGVRAGEGLAIPTGRPRGMGVFFRVGENGKAEATIPITIQTSLDAGEGVQLVAQTFHGQQVRIVPAPNVKNLTGAPGGATLIPDDFSWMPLEGAKEVELVENPDGFGQKKEASRELFQVHIRAGGADSFSLSGLPLEKISYDEKNQLGLDQAAFLLAGLGVAPAFAMKKLSQAMHAGKPVDVLCGRMLKTAAEAFTKAASRAGKALADFNIKPPMLIKEAASLPDPVAVDTVLSLGFLNPENVFEFLKSLPILDDAQSRMCELLIGARLGQRDLPTGALEKAIKATENVIEGLKTIAFQEN